MFIFTTSDVQRYQRYQNKPVKKIIGFFNLTESLSFTHPPLQRDHKSVTLQKYLYSNQNVYKKNSIFSAVPFYREIVNATVNPFPNVAFSSAPNTAGEVSLLFKE